MMNLKQKPTIISIVTPSYNQSEFIEKTIQSVLTQKGDFFIDYIIMDGGSEDQTVEIIQKYEDLLIKNCRIIDRDGVTFYERVNDRFEWNQCAGIHFEWESQKDRGQVDALKKGFARASGQIYCWLNSDDIYVNPYVLQTVCHIFSNEPHIQLLTGDGPFISKEGTELGIHHVDKIQLKELLYLDYHILQPSTFFHKDVYEGKNLQEKYTCAFDADFFIHMIFSGVSYKKINESLGAFRFYPENKTLKLNRIRYREQTNISWAYSKNVFYFLISSIYRYFEIILKSRHQGKSRFFDTVFEFVKRLSYTLITGKPSR